MSNQPSDPFDQSFQDPFASAGADQVDPYNSDPAEEIHQPAGYTNPLAVGSLVSGVISAVMVFTCFCCGPFALVGAITSIVAIVLGLIALPQIRAGKGDGRGLAIAGIICGVAVLLLIALIIGLFFLGNIDAFNNIDNFEWQPDGQIGPEGVLDEDFSEDIDPDLIPVLPELAPAAPDPPSRTPKVPEEGSSNPPGL